MYGMASRQRAAGKGREGRFIRNLRRLMNCWIQKRSKRQGVPECVRTEGIMNSPRLYNPAASTTPRGMPARGPNPLPVLTSNRDDFKLGIDFLLQHPFDGHQRATQRTWATAAGALVANAERVVFQADNLQIAAIACQCRSYFLVEYFIDPEQTRVVAGYRGNRAAHCGC